MKYILISTCILSVLVFAHTEMRSNKIDSGSKITTNIKGWKL